MMALVNYSSSSEEGEEQDDTLIDPNSANSGDLKRKRDSITSDLPPLPPTFHDLYASTTRVSTRDDPSLHGGRKRITPHIEGNWPTHIYIEWYPGTVEYDLLCSIITSFQKNLSSGLDVEAKVESLLTSDLGAPLPLHISLSRPISFATGQKDAFVRSLQENLARCGVRPFEVSLADWDWVPNFEKSRWFLVFRVSKPDGDGLNKLLAVCNETAESYSQPPLYASPETRSLPSKSYEKVGKYRPESSSSQPKARGVEDFSAAFHFSIGWTLENPLTGSTEQLKEVVGNKMSEAFGTVSIDVNAVKVKVGNVVTSISLTGKVTEGRGLFGS